MIKSGDTKICSLYGQPLRLYSRVTRIIRGEYGEVNHIKIRRYHCYNCKKVHRELPDNLMPHKQYDAQIIIDFVDGLVSTNDLPYENYPCEVTAKRWTNEADKIQILIK